MKAAEEEMQSKVFIGGVPDSVTEGMSIVSLQEPM